LRVLGRMLRHGSVEFLVVLLDGSKTLTPADFTEAVAAAVAVPPTAVTVGSVEDLVQLALVVGSLMPPTTAGAGRVEDAAGIQAKEDSLHPISQRVFDLDVVLEPPPPVIDRPAGSGPRAGCGSWRP
jgi:hypothetical protein